jgi:O-glycosyl hydrolase
MTPKLPSLSIFIFLFMLCAMWLPTTVHAATVTVNGAQEFQVIDGFGININTDSQTS